MTFTCRLVLFHIRRVSDSACRDVAKGLHSASEVACIGSFVFRWVAYSEFFENFFEERKRLPWFGFNES